MLDVGMKCLIVGCSTPKGVKHIGQMVVIHQLANHGEDIDPEAIAEAYHNVRWVGGCVAAVIYSPTLGNDDSDMKPEYAIFDPKNLMPLDDIEDPGIDECTFTPIIQQEPA